MDSDDNITLHHIKRAMNEFVTAREWQKYHSPRNLAASVSIEAGELLELFQWTDGNVLDADFRERLSDEMADVLMYLCSLANATQIDLTAAVLNKLEKNERKYPVSEFKGHYYKPRKSKDSVSSKLGRGRGFDRIDY